METCEVLRSLRDQHGLTQEELAERLFVTRQAVSRWENGETLPNTDTLRRLSALFGVSINTLLGAPRQLYCYRCGMPLTDDILSREPDGTPNEDYCQWCYTDGNFTYSKKEDLIDFCVEHLSSENWSKESVREYMTSLLPTLKYWKE